MIGYGAGGSGEGESRAEASVRPSQSPPPPSPSPPAPQSAGTSSAVPPAGGLGSLAAGLLEAEDHARAAAPDAAGASAAGGAGPAVPDDDLPGVRGSRVGLPAAVGAGGFGLLGVLSGLNLLDNAERSVLIVLGPDIQRSLGFSDAALGGIVGLNAVLLTAGAIPIGLLADRYRRTTIAAAAAAAAALFAALSGLVANTFQLVLARIGAGFGQASVLPVHNSLLVDGYPLNGRSAVLAVHNLAGPLGLLLAPLGVGAIASAAGESGWRWAFAAFAVLLGVAATLTLLLREPARGLGEREAVLGPAAAAQLTRLEHETAGRETAGRTTAPGATAPGATAPGATAPGTTWRRATAPPPPVPLEAGLARLLKITTLRYLLLGIGVLGFALVGVPTFYNTLLEEHYGLSAFERGLVGSIIQVGVITGVLAGARAGDVLFRRSPPSAILLLGAAFALHGVLLTVALTAGPLPLLVGLTVLADIPLGAVLVPLFSFVAGVVPYRLRALGFAVVGVCVTLFGGFLGGVILGDISDRYGPRAALLAMVGPTALVAAALAGYGARFVRADLARVVEEVGEERGEIARLAAGGEVPALAVRNLDVSYGGVQVLFGIDLDVRYGEVLALLGTNGAGKSTLLRAVAGLVLPDRGVVRYGGRTVTLDSPQQRVTDGLALVQGGRGVFRSLTVADNLLAAAHTFVSDRALLDARAEEVLGLFPRLADRLDQRAGSLSGGEQQMLALAKALLLHPSVLCIDELSLGLAPAVVAELLDVLTGLRATGVTIVLVEQSVNVACAVADRAVFMEKGRVRFDGRPAELAERGDLVRAVFLGSGGPGNHPNVADPEGRQASDALRIRNLGGEGSA